MKFTKEFLQDLVSHELDVEVIKDELIENDRWSLHYSMIFKLDGKFYETYYQRGATEQQDEQPYEYDNNEIDCYEVFPVEKTITIYERRV